MKKSTLCHAIEEYCTRYEIEITADEILTAADHIGEQYEFWEEYNARCGIHSVNVEILLDNYFNTEEAY